MRKTTVLLVIATMISGICGSVFALSPMGPPKSVLDQDQLSYSLEYENAEMDIETLKGTGYEVGIPGTFNKRYKIDGLKSNMFFANIGLGLTGDWDIYIRLGISDAEDDITEIKYGTARYKGFDGGHEFTWGIGTRATFLEEGDLTWGGLLQVNWANPDSSNITCINAPGFISGNAELEYWEIQMAVGPNFEFDDYRIYGGPFLHFVNGDFNLSENISGQLSFHECDIEENAQFGGYIGTEVYLNTDSSLYAECQFTGEAWGVGLGITWKF